jgi:predicted HAD superfamily Cof-like phosphohydrolase
MKTFADVIEFNQEIIGLGPTEYLNPERLQWFKNTINEELGEFEAANEKYKMDYEASKRINVTEDQLLEDKVDMIDAIMDLIYFALGRLYEIGCTEDDFAAMWNAIHHANMTKKRGNKGRGSDDDAIKPEGWQGPEQVFIKYKKGLKNQLDTCEQTTRRFKTTCENLSLNSSNNSTEIIKNNKPSETTENIQQLHLPGMKYDEGKPNLSLVFGGFNKALLDVGYIGTFGARKYTPNGWKEVDKLYERYSSALLRHMFAAMSSRVKDIYDNETGRLHLAHVAWNALALTEHMLKAIDYDKYNKEALAQSEKTLREHFETLKGKDNG